MYSIHQVHYDPGDNIESYVKVPISLIATDLEDMIEDMELALQAFEQPTLSIEDLDENL